MRGGFGSPKDHEPARGARPLFFFGFLGGQNVFFFFLGGGSCFFWVATMFFFLRALKIF